ncbi:histone acetyltransferase HPA2 [Pseudomonas saudiphocaensis]|nr:histone acetyltransferase HPA2 [Pseudomonas saudiphocaensis]
MSSNERDRSMAATELAAIEFVPSHRRHIDNPQPQQAKQLPSDTLQAGSEPHHPVASREDVRRHTLRLLCQARHSLCLYSPDLEPWLYDEDGVIQASKRFLLGHRRNRLRILLADPTLAIRQSHRLLALARRLTSNLQIRTLNPEYPAQSAAVLVVDHCGLLVRPGPEHTTGYALYQSPGRARAIQRQFDSAWERSLSHPDLRSFLL